MVAQCRPLIEVLAAIPDFGGRERNVQNFSYRPQDIDTYKFMKCGMTRFFQARF